MSVIALSGVRIDGVAVDGGPLERVVRELCGRPSDLADAAMLPAEPGLYAWWASVTVFPELPGQPNLIIGDARLLYLGIATRLRTRVVSNHLARSGSSTLRRTLAGLLLAQEGYRTRWTDRVVLLPDDEIRLTTWMHQHLRLTTALHPEPRAIERQLIERLRPPLNIEGTAAGATRTVIQAARKAYNASAGPRPKKP
ncbi:GIY-YIG nuclease family protein [Frankia sp. CNm7]|nr:GIY-YIG nuclease family protein [Frankia nepalensis]MBL7512162.1 GIY-YIG nuclease family protein [Frankia nepalensis]MBL7520387.1 GIY-YIG nuclease family protein [Frankia nepalensis]